MTLKEAVGKVLEGWTLPNGVRKILEEAYFAELQRTWVSLTDEELFKIWFSAPAETEDRFAFARAIEAKLKEKNT